jgi:BCCT family betaine/carnitine transporter
MEKTKINHKKMDMDVPVTVISVGLIFIFVAFMVIKPKLTLNAINAAFDFTTTWLGSFMLVFMFAVLIMNVFLALSKYGDIKLGDEEPEYSMFSYIAMMALAALASAALFWSFTEWASYYSSPPLGLKPFSTEAAEISLAYSFFHWGLATQSLYVVVGTAIAYAYYVKKVPLMRVSTVCEAMMGNYKHKKLLGKIIDIVCIFGIVGGLGCTLGLAVPLITGALTRAFGLDINFTVQVIIVLVLAALFTFTSFIGTDRGMKNLSNFSAGLCILFLIYEFIMGPTEFIMKNTVNSIGLMLNNYARMSFFTDPIVNGGFPELWTIYFWAFALNYTALMGVFVAKISKGRTIRQLTFSCLFGVTAGVAFMFAINGGFSIHSEITGKVMVTEAVANGQGETAIYQIMNLIPGGVLLPIIYMIMAAGFVASSLDTASLALAQTTTKSLDESGNTNPIQRVFWCIILTLVPLSIMFAKADFSALKTFSIVVSVPFMFVVIFMAVVLVKWLKAHDMSKEQV